MLFEDISNKFGIFEIELVAPRQNKVDVDCAWKPVPYAVFLLMLSPIAGPSFPVYAFPPFSVIWQCLGGKFHGRKRQEWFSPTVADSALVPQVGQNDNFNSAGSISGGFGTGLQE